MLLQFVILLIGACSQTLSAVLPFTSPVNQEACIYSHLIRRLQDGTACDNDKLQGARAKQSSPPMGGSDGVSMKLKYTYAIVSTKGRPLSCVGITKPLKTFSNFRLTCLTMNEPLNGALISCSEMTIVTSTCIPNVTMHFLQRVCEEVRNETVSYCSTFNLNGTDMVCFRDFTVTTCPTYIEKLTTIWDILAYVSIGFIFCSWLMAICIPDSKCKPTYNSDSILRVPRQVYEMYGVPAKRKLSFRKQNRTTFEGKGYLQNPPKGKRCSRASLETPMGTEGCTDTALVNTNLIHSTDTPQPRGNPYQGDTMLYSYGHNGNIVNLKAMQRGVASPIGSRSTSYPNLFDTSTVLDTEIPELSRSSSEDNIRNCGNTFQADSSVNSSNLIGKHGKNGQRGSVVSVEYSHEARRYSFA